MRQTALISRCLQGEICRWNGRRLEKSYLPDTGDLRLVSVCPEMDAGMPCPRPACEIEKGGGADVLDGKSRVLDAFGHDVTDTYLVGAQKTLNMALAENVLFALLKEGSPSCGAHRIKRGGENVAGAGVTAALLTRHGIRIEAIE